jgi:RNA polymerase sigma-70 factor (ECF subfamily)
MTAEFPFSVPQRRIVRRGRGAETAAPGLARGWSDLVPDAMRGKQRVVRRSSRCMKSSSGASNADEAKRMKERLASMTRELRAFARSLCRDPIMADDLVQEALLRAWSKRDSFQHGTNFRAWLFTILRNLYFSQLRRSRREIQDVEGEHAAQVSMKASQTDALELEDFRRALHLLPPEQREALILIGASNLSYGEVAKISECAVGTVKSRVARARIRLLELLAGEKKLPSLDEASESTAELQAALSAPRASRRRSPKKQKLYRG